MTALPPQLPVDSSLCFFRLPRVLPCWAGEGVKGLAATGEVFVGRKWYRLHLGFLSVWFRGFVQVAPIQIPKYFDQDCRGELIVGNTSEDVESINLEMLDTKEDISSIDRNESSACSYQGYSTY